MNKTIRKAGPPMALVLLALAVVFGLSVIIPKPPPDVVEGPQEKTIKAYLTGYTWHDNTPPGSPDIAFSSEWSTTTIHTKAGGVGTFEDPITIAVGHSMASGTSVPDFTPGTRFYVPGLKKYFIVEDLCGDGPTPELIPCHVFNEAAQYAVDEGAEIWLDMWLDGREVSVEMADACARQLTQVYDVIQNPKPGYDVTSGPLC